MLLNIFRLPFVVEIITNFYNFVKQFIIFDSHLVDNKLSLDTGF